jgi:DNA-binding response OmpR family regulator
MSTQQRRLRILLVEDDAIFAAVTAEVMRERALVRWTPTAESAIAAAGEKDWDLIITDIELPGMSGLELVMKIKAAQPHVATLILTGHRSFDNAVEAIRVGADDFLTKPVDRKTLIEKIDELAALSARRKAASSAAVLAIGAHPDDVEVGAGGTLLAHVAQGHEVSILVLTGGEIGGIPAERAREATRAAELMGVRLFHVNLADSSVSEGGATIAAGTGHDLHPQRPRPQPGPPQRASRDDRRSAPRAPNLLLPELVVDRRVPPDPLRPGR